VHDLDGERVLLVVRHLQQKSSVTRDRAREYSTTTENGLGNWSTSLSSQGSSTHGEPRLPVAEGVVNQGDVENWCLPVLEPLMKILTKR
jgi:hypothetical protein